MLHVLSVFCSKFLPSAVFSPHLTYDTVGEVLLFGTCRCTRFFFSLQVYTDTVAELNYFT